MAVVNSPNMNLPVPVVGVEVGPAWASDLNVCLGALDSHTHAAGAGVSITPAGLNINTDLSFGSNNATQLRTLRFNSQGASLVSASDKACLYVVGTELYYNDGGGTVIPITKTGSVNAGAGSITGLPNGTAGVSYATGTYTFAAATNTPANLDALNHIFRNNVASGFGLTLSAPTLVGNYQLVMPFIPASAPNGGKLLALDVSGNITAAVDVDNSTLQYSANLLQVKNGGITTTQVNSAAGILGTQLANLTVGAAQITNNTITTAQVGVNALTSAAINVTTLNSVLAYTPSLTSASYANVASITISPVQASRVMNVGTMSGMFTLTTDSSGLPASGQFRFNPPFMVGSFTQPYHAGGIGIEETTFGLFSIRAATGTGTVLVRFSLPAAVATTVYIIPFSMTYQIL